MLQKMLKSVYPIKSNKPIILKCKKKREKKIKEIILAKRKKKLRYVIFKIRNEEKQTFGFLARKLEINRKWNAIK